MTNTAAHMLELAAGLAEAATELGTLFRIYRTRNLTNGVWQSPLLTESVGSVLASFPRDYTYRLPTDPKKPQCVAVLDLRQIAVADYLYDDDVAYFVQDMSILVPVTAIKCNTTVSIEKQSNIVGPQQVGGVPKFGNVSVGPNKTVTPLLQDWPCSLLYSGRGAKPLGNIPTNENAPQWTALLPLLPIAIAENDIVVNGNKRMTVLAAEQTSGGWRLFCNSAEY